MINESRSERASLEDGATDGKYRKVRPNTAVDDPTMGHHAMMVDRSGLNPDFGYDYIAAEPAVVVNPTARIVR